MFHHRITKRDLTISAKCDFSIVHDTKDSGGVNIGKHVHLYLTCYFLFQLPFEAAKYRFALSHNNSFWSLPIKNKGDCLQTITLVKNQTEILTNLFHLF
jgi:hypothetical protein